MFKTVLILLVAIQIALPRLPLGAGAFCPQPGPLAAASDAAGDCCVDCCCPPSACPCVAPAPEAPPEPEPATPPAPRIELLVAQPLPPRWHAPDLRPAAAAVMPVAAAGTLLSQRVGVCAAHCSWQT